MTAKQRRRIIIERSLRRPFWDGVARIFDFTGLLNRPARMLPPDVADQYAIWSDWKAIGDDFRAIMGSHPPNRASARNRKG